VARAHTPHPGPVDLPPCPNVPADMFPALCLGSTGGDQDHRVPRAPLPGLGVTQHRGVLRGHLRGYYRLLHRSYGLMRQTTVLPTPRWSLGGGVCAGCRESLLDHGPSRHYLCHLCVGAWTHTPPCPSGAHAHPFPNGSGLTSRETRSAHGRNPARRFPQGALSRGCSHSLMFRPPHSLDLQIVPTAVHRLGGQAVYTTHRPRGYPPQDVVSLRVCMGI
jgi:hypothetical protein